jgi:hypothetical protein
MRLRRWYSGLSRGRKVAFIAAVLLVSYAVVGFLVLPLVVRSQAAGYLEETLDRRVVIERVRINPFALTASIEGLEIGDRDGSDFLSWEKVFANLQLASILEGGPTFRELRLSAPVIHLKILPDGQLNVADIPEAFASEEPEEEDEETAEEPLPFLAALIVIERGRFVFSDLSHPTPFRQELGPVDLSLTDFATLPGAASTARFAAETKAGETFAWEGSLAVVPPSSSGTITIDSFQPRTGWRYFQDNVRFEVTEGTFDVSVTYEASLTDGELALAITDSSVLLEDFKLLASDADEPILEIPRLEVDGVAVDLGEQRVDVASIELDGVRMRGWIREDGRPHYSTLISESIADGDVDGGADGSGDGDADGGEEGEQPAPAVSDATDAPEPWTWKITAVDVADLGLEYEDRSTPTPAAFDLHPIALTAGNLTNAPGAVADLDLDLTLNDSGKLDVVGKASIEPLWAEVDVTLAAIPLSAFQPYVAAVAALEVTDGSVSAQASVAYHPGREGGPLVETRGALSIDDLATREASAGDALLGWKKLAFEELVVDVEPTSVRIGTIELVETSANIVVREDGTTNLAAITAGSSAHGDTGDAGDASAAGDADVAGANDVAAGAAPPPAAVAIPIVIDQVVLENVALDVRDRSVEPTFDFSLSELSGTIAGLSSSAGARADVDLAARLDRTGKLGIEGQIDPLGNDAYTDLRVALTNFDLGGFSPYAGRYIGRTISSGRLSLELEYKIAEDILVGENGVEVDTFTLGRHVQSEDATSLPVGLALALLKDASGRIDFDLPVRGDLSDPAFSLGGILLEALTNLITKIVASPFNLVGRLVPGGGENLDFIAFEPGADAAGGAEGKKIAALTKALEARPALGLEIFGTASRDKDIAGLQARRLETRLREMHFDEIKGKKNAPATADEVVLDPDDRAGLLEELYRETFDAKPKELLEALPQPEPEDTKAWLRTETERRLRESFAITDADLEELARARADGIRDALTAGGIDAERLFVVDTVIVEQTEGSVRGDLVLVGL